LRPVAGRAQLVDRIFIDQRLAQVETLDDLANRRLFWLRNEALPPLIRRSCAHARGRGSARAPSIRPSSACSRFPALEEGHGERIEVASTASATSKAISIVRIGQLLIMILAHAALLR
jgi:hypothetical protein